MKVETPNVTKQENDDLISKIVKEMKPVTEEQKREVARAREVFNPKARDEAAIAEEEKKEKDAKEAKAKAKKEK